MAIYLFIIIGIVAGLSGLWGYFYWLAACKPPANTPETFLKKGRSAETSTLVVCAGDSITHATVSGDYVALLRERFGPQGYEFVNAGINGDLAYNLLRRLDEIIACRPDIITILIGTNDVNSTLDKRLERRYIREKKLPQAAHQTWYFENLHQIIRRIKAETGAQIAVCSLPLLGEKLESEANRRTGVYSEMIKEIAEAEGVIYLPLHEKMKAYLIAHNGQDGPHYQGQDGPLYLAASKRYLQRKKWDQIGDEIGFALLTDHLHLNDRAAAMVADLITGYLQSTVPAKEEG